MGKSGTRNGVKLTEETKRKIRIGGIEAYKKKHNVYPSPRVNPIACKMFERLEERLGWNGQYATHGGEFHIKELGYWVDYYEPQLNIVVEYDERHHSRRKDKDANRQKEIETYLGCRFIRISEYDTFDEAVLKCT